VTIQVHGLRDGGLRPDRLRAPASRGPVPVPAAPPVPPPALYRRIALGSVLVMVLAVVGSAIVVAGQTRPPRREAATVTAAAVPVPAPSAPYPALRELAARHGLVFGSAVEAQALATNPGYAVDLAREFSSVTAESAMKWDAVEPTRGQPDFTAGDALVAFARAHGQVVYGHNLVWYTSLPAWLTTGGYTDDEYAQLLQGHITAEVGHFRHAVWAWDVVNEPLANDGTLRTDLWTRHLGPGYVADALRWAHAADPNAVLFLNDYGIEDVNAKSDGMYRLVRDLLAQGVPIGGVGFQMHLETAGVPRRLAENLRRFTALGLQVAITEMDVRVQVPAPRASLDRQAAVYTDAVTACLAVPGCVSFTVWGFTDAISWIPDTYDGYGQACLLDATLAPKPAYWAVAGALRAATSATGR